MQKWKSATGTSSSLQMQYVDVHYYSQRLQQQPIALTIQFFTRLTCSCKKLWSNQSKRNRDHQSGDEWERERHRGRSEFSSSRVNFKTSWTAVWSWKISKIFCSAPILLLSLFMLYKKYFRIKWRNYIFFLLLLLSHLISKLWSPSIPQRSHKGNEIEKLIVDLWMLWEKGRKIVSVASARTPIFPFPILSLFGTLSLLEQSIRRNFPSSETLEWWQSALVRRWFRINAAGSVTYVTQLLCLTSVGRLQKQRNGIKTNFVYVCEIFNSTWPDGLRLISSRNTFV